MESTHSPKSLSWRGMTRRRQPIALGIDDWEDPEEWEAVLDCYDERFLWDLDYQDEQGLDLPPDQEAATRAMMGVADDYYTSVSPDLRADDTLDIGVKRLMRIANAATPEG